MATPDTYVRLDPLLALLRCPHCSVDTPHLEYIHEAETHAHDNSNRRHWRIYKCRRCGGLITAWANQPGDPVHEVYPGSAEVDAALPSPARSYLQQATQSLHAPAGAVMLAASSVDAMLKAKGYKDGSLYSRIEKAAADHLITADMSIWAHQVRLDANDQRHADDGAALPSETDARRSAHFATALAAFLFTLPSMVTRGIKESSTNEKNKKAQQKLPSNSR